MDIKAAQVVCRELGCGTVLAVPGSGRFEAGTGPLWEGGFECNGTEPLLAACTRRPPRSQGCTGHASIICSRKRWGCRGLSGGSPHHRAPPPPTPFLPQPTRVSGWRTTARAALGGWRRRRGGRGGPSAPPTGTCPTPTSSATTSAVALLPPCPREAPSAGGMGRCGRTPLAAAGASGTRASAPQRCWGSPPAPLAMPLPSTAQVCMAPPPPPGKALRGFWDTPKIGSGGRRAILG